MMDDPEIETRQSDGWFSSIKEVSVRRRRHSFCCRRQWWRCCCCFEWIPWSCGGSRRSRGRSSPSAMRQTLSHTASLLTSGHNDHDWTKMLVPEAVPNPRMQQSRKQARRVASKQPPSPATTAHQQEEKEEPTGHSRESFLEYC